MNKKIIEKALSQWGVTEIRGEKDNAEILKYFQSLGLSYKDETAWCSAFMNWVAKTVGAEYSGALNARSWLKIGRTVESPEQGDVVVFWRVSPSDWRGHVGVFIKETSLFVYVLGGNQNNRVCIKAYQKGRVLSYRRLNLL